MIKVTNTTTSEAYGLVQAAVEIHANGERSEYVIRENGQSYGIEYSSQGYQIGDIYDLTPNEVEEIRAGILKS